jgi:hypothetical protein
VARNERRRAGWWSSPPVKTGVSHEIRGSSFYRPQNRLQPAATAGGAAPQPDPTVYRLQPELDQGGDPPEPCPHLMETPTAAAAVSPSPGDTVSAPCRRSRPGPAALDRLRQWWGPAPARPKPVWSTRRVEHGGQRREAAMGKGLPGGRRQAGRIDYWIEPRSSLPSPPTRSTSHGAYAGAQTHQYVSALDLPAGRSYHPRYC